MLLKRKSEEGLSEWEAEAKAKVLRSSVSEQRNTPTLQVQIAQDTRILPYSYFQEARFHREDKAWEIELYWPSVTVTIKGINLEKMVRQVAEHALASLEFHPDGDKHMREDRPEFESITLTPRAEGPLPPRTAEAKPREAVQAAPRHCYSVV